MISRSLRRLVLVIAVRLSKKFSARLELQRRRMLSCHICTFDCPYSVLPGQDKITQDSMSINVEYVDAYSSHDVNIKNGTVLLS